MSSELEIIASKIEKLSYLEQLRVIQVTVELLQKNGLSTITNRMQEATNGLPAKHEFLEYGKYANYPGPETTEEDFKDAEYHFNEDEWK